jgi:hypothetical protein
MHTHNSATDRGRAAVRRAAAAGVLVLGLGGLAACGDEATDAEAQAQDAAGEAFAGLEENVEGLQDRVEALEDGALLDNAGDLAENADPGLFTDPSSFLDQEVSVSGEVQEVLDAAGNSGVYVINEDGGSVPVVVITENAPPEVQAGDTISVSGSVEEISESSFAEDFGANADELLGNAQDFLDTYGGDYAVAADEIAVTQGG